MESSESTPRQRRVGTFTLGAVLVAAGILMAVSLFWPQLDLRWTLKAAPLILIALGAETLLAARGGGKVKYDWVGMVLCFLLTCAALALYAASWLMLYGPSYSGSIESNDHGLLMEYSAFHTTQDALLELEAGDTIEADIVSLRGSVSVTVIEEADREVVYDVRDLPTGTFSIPISQDGTYELWVTGDHAAGSARFTRSRPG